MQALTTIYEVGLVKTSPFYELARRSIKKKGCACY